MNWGFAGSKIATSLDGQPLFRILVKERKKGLDELLFGRE